MQGEALQHQGAVFCPPRRARAKYKRVGAYCIGQSPISLY